MTLQPDAKGRPGAPAAEGNGAVGAAARPAPMRPRDARQTRFAQSFAQIVAVLMRDPQFRSMRLADLEWLVLPPVMAGQFRLAHAATPAAKASQSAVSVRVAVALWARVSDAVDKALSGNLDKAVQLHASQWASGDNIWLMAVAGDARAVPKFMAQLAETEFKGRRAKMRMQGPDGKVVVKTLGEDEPISKEQATGKG